MQCDVCKLETDKIEIVPLTSHRLRNQRDSLCPSCAGRRKNNQFSTYLIKTRGISLKKALRSGILSLIR